MPLLTDCTATLRLLYDRGPAGYGVPVSGSRFMGTSKLQGVLMDVRRDLEQIGWWPHIESVLTAGLYVNKKGAHGDGIAWDFDGVVLKPNPLTLPHSKIITILSYAAEPREKCWKHYRWYALHPRIRTRFACLLSLRFGVVLTAGYNKAHEDHIHADLSRTVKWRSGSRSQVILLQETLNAFYDGWLKVDGIFGKETNGTWVFAMTGEMGGTYSDMSQCWLAWLKMIAFNPPKDVK